MLRVLTLVSSDGIDQLDLRVVFPHLFYHFACLKGQLIGGRHTQALMERKQWGEDKRYVFMSFNGFQGRDLGEYPGKMRNRPKL